MSVSQKKNPPDYFLIIGVFLLVVFGLIMVNSVTNYDFYQNPDKIETAFMSDTAWKQILLTVAGIILWAVVSQINYLVWKRFSPMLYVIGVFLLLLLFHPAFGKTLNGATGWLDFGSFFPSIQPVEFVKIATILYLARWLEPKVHELKTLDAGFIPFGIIVGVVILLIAAQPDFGGFLVLFPVCLVMFYVAGARLKHLLMVFLVSLMLCVIGITAFKHIRDRFSDFMDPTVDPSNKNVGWQIQQSLIAVGSGGFMGRGINKSVQKMGYLPEVERDTIFAAIAEETGFRGTLALILVYLFVCWRGFVIAYYAPDKFARYASLGLSFLILWQAFVNIAVTIKLFPLTGITLPFISAGGSSLLINLFSVGILVNISRYSSIPHAHFAHRRRVGRAHISSPRVVQET